MVAPTPSSSVGLSSPSALWAKAIAASAARSVAGLQPSSALSVRKAATWTGAAGRVRTPRPLAHFVHLAQWDLYTFPGARAVRLAEGVGDAASAFRPQDGHVAARV